MHLITFLIILIAFFNLRYIVSISIQNTNPSVTNHADIINEGYAQCKASNEVCSSNNDCCSTCCTSFTYSAMTCQDNCPDIHNVQRKEDKTHGNVVWKSKQSDDNDDEKKRIIEDRNKVISRQHRENIRNNDSTLREIVDEDLFRILDSEMEHISDKNNENKTPILEMGKLNVAKVETKPLEMGKLNVAKVETKPNKDIGMRIKDDSGNYSIETVAKTRKNVEVGLSIKEKKDEDLGENKNTDIGTSIIKIGDKVKEDDSGENQNTDIGTPIIKISEKASKENQGKRTKELNNSIKHAHSKEGSNKDLGGDVITIQTLKKEKSMNKDQVTNDVKVVSNKTSLEKRNATSYDSKNQNISNNTDISYKKSELAKNIITENKSPPINNTTSTTSTPCTQGEKTCESHQSLADNIKDILTQKLPSLISLNPTTVTSKKPMCKTTGSICKHPAQCCSQCCAVSDGVFKCFDKGTDECQSSLPGATDPKCKKTGDYCETHSECCLNKCTDCGHFSACDSGTNTICRTEGKSVLDSKLCKHLGDICGEASECCTQCCAVSDGVFKCFEEGTHECQPGDSVYNTTISELVEVAGYAN